MKSAIILTWEGFQDHEVIYPYYSLKEHGYDVTVVANKLGRIHGINGDFIKCDVTIDVLNNNSMLLMGNEILVIPGGVKALEKLRQDKNAIQFVQNWNIRHKTMFVLCNGAQLLISAKILKGRTISGYYSIDVDIENAGATYSKGPVCVDGNIISCPHYDFMGEWMRKGYEVHELRNK
jgi:protease I